MTVVVCFLSSNTWAIQEALVITDRAVIYSDRALSSSLGFISRGKKIKVGEITQSKHPIYPVVISGKIAYIRARDVSTDKDQLNQKEFISQRFLRATELEFKTSYSLSYVSYATQINIKGKNNGLSDKDAVNFSGVELKGEAIINPKWDLQILGGYYTTPADDEKFKLFELGIGAGYRIWDSGKFSLKADVQFLAIPFAQYSKGSLYSVNGYGFTTGAGLNASYRIGDHWGMEAFGGLYYTKVTGFKVPAPYQSIDPSFVGNRLGLGLNYRF